MKHVTLVPAKGARVVVAGKRPRAVSGAGGERPAGAPESDERRSIRKSPEPAASRTVAGAFAGALALLALSPGLAGAALDVTEFSVTPSDPRGRPPEPRRVDDVRRPERRHQGHRASPAGRIESRRARDPFCPRKRLLADLCPSRTKVGKITVAAEVLGFDVTATNVIFNGRPVGAESVRLAVPIYGSLSRPGIAAELPVTKRPADGGLDLAVRGLPSEVGGIRPLIKRVSFTLQGLARVRVKGRLRERAFLTSPSTCTAATSVLEVTSQVAGHRDADLCIRADRMRRTFLIGRPF